MRRIDWERKLMNVNVSFKMTWQRNVARPRKTRRSSRPTAMPRHSVPSKSNWTVSSARDSKTRRSSDWPKRKKMKRGG